MNGQTLNTFIVGLNGGTSIDSVLLNVLINTAKTIIESERDWMVLRKTDPSKTVTTANTYTTVIDLSTITDFSHFYGEFPVRLFDGTNRIEYYRLVPFDRRLTYKDVSNTACYDENSKTLYLNGTVPFSGTLYLNYIVLTDDIDVTTIIPAFVWSPFLSRFVPMLGFYAIGIHMGGVDYDSITARQQPTQMATMLALKNAMATWDDKKQASAIEGNDPSNLYSYPRSGAIDRSGDDNNDF